MKKISSIVIIGILLTTSSLIFAQDKGEDDKIGGLRIGYQVSALFMDGEKYDGSEQMPSIYVGFFRDNPVASILSIGTGLEYVQTGIQEDGEKQRALHYVSIPVSLKAKIGPVFAQTGFVPSFKVAERVYVAGEAVKPLDDLKSEWFDVPFFIGGGVKLAFLTIEARYHLGLLEVREGYTSKYFQVGIGLSF